jgi:glyoxylase I family protein
MKVSGFHHVAVQVKDVARVAAFYVETLGLLELKRFHREDGSLRSIWVGTSSDSAQGFLAVEQLDSQSVEGALGFSMVALRIDAAHRQAIIEELGRRGVKVEKQTGWTLYVRDPEGNLVGLSHHPDSPPNPAASE